MGEASCSRAAGNWLRHYQTASYAPKTVWHTVSSHLSIWNKLSKAKLSLLVVFTAGTGFVVASPQSVDYAKLAWTSAGTFLTASCANTLNQLYERHNDKLMTRTKSRPLPSGRISPRYAIIFAAATGATGAWMLYEVNPTTAALGVFNVVLYAGVYTPMKQMTWYNTWVGSVVGAVPPAMGWTAANGPASFGSLVLPTALFLWQIPHFLGLAWLHAADYERAGYRMLPYYDPLGHRTARIMVRYSVLMMPIGAAAVLGGIADPPFAVEAAAAGVFITHFAMKFSADRRLKAARLVFTRSLWYLPALCGAIMFHRVP